eukprot:scaffold2332_cov50-Attheya_sp.AAC.3
MCVDSPDLKDLEPIADWRMDKRHGYELDHLLTQEYLPIDWRDQQPSQRSQSFQVQEEHHPNTGIPTTDSAQEYCERETNVDGKPGDTDKNRTDLKRSYSQQENIHDGSHINEYHSTKKAFHPVSIEKPNVPQQYQGGDNDHHQNSYIIHGRQQLQSGPQQRQEVQTPDRSDRIQESNTITPANKGSAGTQQDFHILTQARGGSGWPNSQQAQRELHSTPTLHGANVPLGHNAYNQFQAPTAADVHMHMQNIHSRMTNHPTFPIPFHPPALTSRSPSGSSTTDSHQTPANAVTFAHRPGDVLCGRGGATNNHPGNIFYRHLVNKYRKLYLNALRKDKPSVAELVVDLIRERGGRFLTKEKDGMLWIDIGDVRAGAKAGQALREEPPAIRRRKKEKSRLKKEADEKSSSESSDNDAPSQESNEEDEEHVVVKQDEN